MERVTETTVMWPGAQGHLGPPGAGRGRSHTPVEPSEGGGPTDSLMSDLWPSEMIEKFLLF